MTREHALYAFIIFQAFFDFIMIGLFLIYSNNFMVMNDNQMTFYHDLQNMGKVTGMVSTIIPEMTKAHNDMVEGFIINDPDLINITGMFMKAMDRVAKQGKLDAFYNCTPKNFSRYDVNFPIFDAVVGKPRKMIGYETATYDMNDNFNHVESMYVSKDWVIWNKFGCAMITYTGDDDRLEIRVIQNDK